MIKIVYFEYVNKGFRDVFKKLQNDYKFFPKMPSCRQLKEDEDNDEELDEKNQKQLTTKESNENRLITKVKIHIFIKIKILNIILSKDKVYY